MIKQNCPSAIPKKYWYWYCQYFLKVLLTTLHVTIVIAYGNVRRLELLGEYDFDIDCIFEIFALESSVSGRSHLFVS